MPKNTKFSLFILLIKAPFPFLQLIQFSKQSVTFTLSIISTYSLMKKNSFLKDLSRFKLGHSQVPFQRDPSADQSFANSSHNESLLLDGIDVHISANSSPGSQKESQKNEINQTVHPKNHLNPGHIKYQAKQEKIASRPKEVGEKQLNQAQYDISQVNLSFGTSSPGSRNLRNVPMTRSIITVGSACRDQEIPSPKINPANYERPSRYGQNYKGQNKSPNQNKSDDFPVAKSQKNNSSLDKKFIEEQKQFENSARFLEVSQSDHLPQQQSQSQSNPSKNDQTSNPFGKVNDILQRENIGRHHQQIDRILKNQKDHKANQEIRNSKNQETKIRRSRSHSQPNIKSKEKNPQPVIIHQKPEPQFKKSSPRNQLIQKSIIDQLDDEVSLQKDNPKQKQSSDSMDSESQKTISIRINDAHSTSSIFEYFKDKENRRVSQNVDNQNQIMEQENESKSKIQKTGKNPPVMNRSIDFNTIKSKSRPKNAVLSKNYQKNTKERLTQKFKKELDNSENLTEDKLLMARAITQNSLTQFKDMVIKLVLENEKEHLQKMTCEMMSCIEEIQETTNMARIQRKIMSRNLNKAKKQISALKQLNLRYEKFLQQACDSHNEKLRKVNENFRGKYSGIGATIQNGKIIFTEQMAQEYIELIKKEQVRKREILSQLMQRQQELKSLYDENDPCQMLLSSPTNQELLQIMKSRSENEQALILNFIDFRNMMINTYVGICLEKYPNSIPERLAFLQRRDNELIDFFMENEIETPKEFIRESKKMLSHLQQFAEEHQKM